MTGGTTAIVGCVPDGGRFAVGGIDAAPDGGARFTAAPVSGTNAGGIGGGRSLNNCALTGSAANKTRAKANICHSRPRRPNPVLASPPEIMVPAFQRKRGKFKPSRPRGAARNGPHSRELAHWSRSRRKIRLTGPERGINHASCLLWRGVSAAHSLIVGIFR
jgi:hypothetical protein